MRNRKKPEQMFHDGRMKLKWRRFNKYVRFVCIKQGLIKNPEFD
jgi:hypothetical protein